MNFSLLLLFFALSCARNIEAPSAQTELDAGFAPEPKGRAGASCGSARRARMESECEEGLVCCFAPSGVYDPNAQGTCMSPCRDGAFCMNGCYSPPVP